MAVSQRGWQEGGWDRWRQRHSPPPLTIFYSSRGIYLYCTHTSPGKEKRMARSFFGPPVVYICQHTHRKLPAHFFSLSTPPPALLTYYYSLIPPSPSSQLIQSHSTCNIISLARTYTSHRPASHWFLPCGRRPSRCTLSPPPPPPNQDGWGDATTLPNKSPPSSSRRKRRKEKECGNQRD